MKTKAFAVITMAQGDLFISLVNEEAWDYLDDGVASDGVVQDYMFSNADEHRNDVIDILSLENAEMEERAANLAPSIFDGEIFPQTGTLRELFEFCAKHNLDLQHEQYEGEDPY